MPLLFAFCLFCCCFLIIFFCFSLASPLLFFFLFCYSYYYYYYHYCTCCCLGLSARKTQRLQKIYQKLICMSAVLHHLNQLPEQGAFPYFIPSPKKRNLPAIVPFLVTSQNSHIRRGMGGRHVLWMCHTHTRSRELTMCLSIVTNSSVL